MTLSAQILSFIDDVADETHDVLTGAFADVVDEASTPKTRGGLMPVDTGELRDSVTIRSNGGVTKGANNARGAIKSAPVGSTIEAHWDKDYAVYVEMGTSKAQPQPFLRTATAKFPRRVRDNARRARANG